MRWAIRGGGGSPKIAMSNSARSFYWGKLGSDLCPVNRSFVVRDFELPHTVLRARSRIFKEDGLRACRDREVWDLPDVTADVSIHPAANQVCGGRKKLPPLARDVCRGQNISQEVNALSPNAVVSAIGAAYLLVGEVVYVGAPKRELTPALGILGSYILEKRFKRIPRQTDVAPHIRALGMLTATLSNDPGKVRIAPLPMRELSQMCTKITGINFARSSNVAFKDLLVDHTIIKFEVNIKFQMSSTHIGQSMVYLS